MRFLVLLFALLPMPALAEDILLSGPPIWESAPLIALAQSQPVEGVTFTFRPWANPEELRKTLMADEPLMAVAPSPSAAIFAANGIRLRVLSATATGNSIAIVGRGEPLTRLADLHGGKLALPFRGYLPDLMIRRIGAPGSESWQPHYTGDHIAGMQLLLAGRVDAAMLAEPMATLALAQDPDLRRLADLCVLWREATQLAVCPPAGVVIANPAFQDRSEIREAYRAAFAELAADPGKASALLALHFPGMDKAGDGFARIEAQDLPMPDRAAELAAFYAEILAVEPAAVGGKLPGPDFYGQ